MRSSGVVLGQPGLRAGGVGVGHDDRVAGAHLGLVVAAERGGQTVADEVPVLLGVGRVQRHLARAGRRGVAVEGDARAVGAAIAHLGEHRAQVLAEPILDGG